MPGLTGASHQSCLYCWFSYVVLLVCIYVYSCLMCFLLYVYVLLMCCYSVVMLFIVVCYGTSYQSEERIDATAGLLTSSPTSAFCRSGILPMRAHSFTTSS